MKVIVLASQKGGAGKTTITGHLAVEATRAGIGTVALIDTDPQQGLTGWWKARTSDSIPMIKVSAAGLAATLKKLRAGGVALVIIDTPPAITASIRETVALADLVVIPAKPSPHDLRAVGATVDIVASKGRQMIFVINQAIGRARITGDAAVALSQHGTVAPVTLHSRIDFAVSMSDGRVAVELDPASKSATEITALWTYVATRLGRLDTYDEATARSA